MAFNRASFDKLTFPKIPPENAVREYLTSKKQDELLIRKYPRWDVARISPSTELVTAKRELHEVEQRLLTKRLEQEKNRNELDRQWDDLAEKEKLFRTSFIKFHQFVRGNEEKRARAEKKISEEIATQKKRDAEIQQLTESYEFMKNVKQSLEESVQKYQMYEDYLNAVAKSTSSFKSVMDILNRYEALVDAKKQLALRQQQDLIALENARNLMTKLVEDKMRATLRLNVIVAELQVRYERAKGKALQADVYVTKIKNICVQKMCDINEVRMACWNIYKQMCRRKEITPEIHKDDFANQLMFIKKTLEELQYIVRIAKRRNARDSIWNRQDSS